MNYEAAYHHLIGELLQIIRNNALPHDDWAEPGEHATTDMFTNNIRDAIAAAERYGDLKGA